MSLQNKQATDQKFNYFEIILRLVLMVALASATAAAITYFDVLKLSVNFNANFLYLAAVLQVFFWLLSTYSWQKAVSITTSVKLPFKDCFIQNALLLVGKYIPGKVLGIIIRGHRLKKFGIGADGSIHATYLEQLNSTHAGFVFGIICWLIAIEQQWRWLVIIIGLSSFVIVPFYHGKVIGYLLDYLPEKWRCNIQKYAVIEMSVRDYLFMACLYQIEWLLLGGIAIFVFIAMTGTLTSINVSILLVGSNTLGMVVGFIALFAPAGIGVREVVNGGILLGSLTAIEIAGFVILLRCWSVCADIMIGGLAILFSRKK